MTILTGPLAYIPQGVAAAPAMTAIAAIAANDNDGPQTNDGLLRAALRHFADHGLGAAELAQQRAERAFFAGDGKEYRHWLDICRALDRRLAATYAQRQELGG